MEIIRNIKPVLERQDAKTLMPHNTRAPTIQPPRHLFNNMEEYSKLKKANRFEPSWALIRIQQARERERGL